MAYEGRHPLGECLAEKAIELIGQHLVAAVQDGGNQAARDGMALAATIAGLAFSNCAVALVHALEYPLGGAVHCSHGAGNGLLLPYVMRYNLPVRTGGLRADRRAARRRRRPALRERAAAERADRRRRADLAPRSAFPQRIRDLGGTREQLPAFAEKAFAIKRLMGTNPRQPHAGRPGRDPGSGVLKAGPLAPRVAHINPLPLPNTSPAIPRRSDCAGVEACGAWGAAAWARPGR